MIRNYFKIAWRNLWRNKTFSAINIFGWAIGLCCFLLITLYVTDELSYDRYNDKADRIYRINMDARMRGQDIHLAVTPDQMGQLLKQDNPQVAAYTRIFTNDGDKLVKKGTEYLTETRVANVDSSFFQVFSLPAIAGNTQTALDAPNTVVITATTARKYFGTTQAVGKVLEVQAQPQDIPYKVTAVIKDIPENSHFQFDMLFSMKNVDYPWGNIGNHNFYTYLLLQPGTDASIFDKKLQEYIIRYLFPDIMKRANIKSWEEFEKAGNIARYSLIPVTDIHLRSDRPEEIQPSGNIQYIYIFSAVALFILLIACINFMNLTTARAAGRAKEVGIRKVMGTGRKELILQFLTESTLTAMLSLLIAIGLAYLALPLFNALAGKNIPITSLFSRTLLPWLIVLPFIVGLLAGSYPAFFLSAFKPVEVLKGRLQAGNKSISLRSALVVFQFATSVILIIGTLIVYQQLHYIQHKNIGFNKDQVLIINAASALGNQVEAFKNEVLQLPGIKSGTVSAFLPVSNSARSANSVSREAVADAQSIFNMQNWPIDYDYLETMGMQLIKGRNFSREFGTDASAVIINEAAAKILGYDDPVGHTMYTMNNGTTIPHTIIGMVKDFNYETLHREVGPLNFFLASSPGLVSFKVNTPELPSLIAQIKSKWAPLAPGVPFSYRFMDASFNAMYDAEQRVGKIVLLFSVLAIVIAGMGIFGLATFIAQQRMKEIGIRKTLGASVQSIVQLLSLYFLKLVTIAFIIAAPIAWWMMHHWLQDFAYRIHISGWVFVLAGIVSLLIALLTVSYQAISAALMNPLKSLNTE
jgi:putative ABC transport system permease protein